MKRYSKTSRVSLTLLVEQIIAEQMKEADAIQYTKNIVNNSKLLNLVKKGLESLSNQTVDKLKRSLLDLGIHENMSVETANSIVKQERALRFDNITESDEQDRKNSLSFKIGKVLASFGLINMASWAGVPLGMIIGGYAKIGFIGGIAASWAVTAICLLLAKALGLTEDEMNTK